MFSVSVRLRRFKDKNTCLVILTLSNDFIDRTQNNTCLPEGLHGDRVCGHAQRGDNTPVDDPFPPTTLCTIIYFGGLEASEGIIIRTHHNTFDSLKASMVTLFADMPSKKSALALVTLPFYCICLHGISSWVWR